MAEVINNKVFIPMAKFIDVHGLDYFWSKAKEYIDGVDNAVKARVNTLETTVNGTEAENYADGLVKKVEALRSDVDTLGGTGEGGIQGMIDASIAALDLPNTYEAKGEAAKAQAAAESTAKKYTNTVVGTYTDGETPATGLRKEIEDKEKALSDAIDAVEAAAKTYSITKVTEGLGANVKEAYRLVDEDNVQIGAQIDIYKDSALQEVKLNGQALEFTYLLADGKTDMVSVDVSSFLAESEFKNGLQVVDHVVSVKVDAASEGFLTVGEAGVKLSGVQSAIDAAKQAAIDAAAAAQTTALSNYYTKKEVDVIKDEINGVIEENEKTTAEALTNLDTRVKALAAQDVYVKATVDKQITDAAAAAQAAAEATAKTYTDEQLGNYTAEGVLATGLRKEIEESSAADRAYAKTYTDALFASMSIASDDDILLVFKDGVLPRA